MEVPKPVITGGWPTQNIVRTTDTMGAPFIRSFIANERDRGAYAPRFRVRSAICFKLRSASLTASESGKVSSRSGAIIAISALCRTRS